MNIITKIKCWIIKKLGGYTEEEYNDIYSLYFTEIRRTEYKSEKLIDAVNKYTALEKTIRTVESYITIDNALGYTEDNVIAESRQQTYYQLGKAVYPYAHHILTSDGKYICAVNVQEVE